MTKLKSAAREREAFRASIAGMLAKLTLDVDGHLLPIGKATAALLASGTPVTVPALIARIGETKDELSARAISHLEQLGAHPVDPEQDQ